MGAVNGLGSDFTWFSSVMCETCVDAIQVRSVVEGDTECIGIEGVVVPIRDRREDEGLGGGCTVPVVAKLIKRSLNKNFVKVLDGVVPVRLVSERVIE